MLEIDWECHTCSFRGALPSIEKLQHMSICKKENVSEKSTSSSLPVSKKKNAVAYECPVCQKTMYLLPTEVLKHRKQHET